MGFELLDKLMYSDFITMRPLEKAFREFWIEKDNLGYRLVDSPDAEIAMYFIKFMLIRYSWNTGGGYIGEGNNPLHYKYNKHTNEIFFELKESSSTYIEYRGYKSPSKMSRLESFDNVTKPILSFEIPSDDFLELLWLDWGADIKSYQKYRFGLGSIAPKNIKIQSHKLDSVIKYLAFTPRAWMLIDMNAFHRPIHVEGDPLGVEFYEAMGRMTYYRDSY